jgi:hypothetical protein
MKSRHKTVRFPVYFPEKIETPDGRFVSATIFARELLADYLKTRSKKAS